MVILDPLGWWNVIREFGRDWAELLGGRPRGVGGRPAPKPDRLPVRSRGFWSLLDGRKLHGALISLCNTDMWAFLAWCINIS